MNPNLPPPPPSVFANLTPWLKSILEARIPARLRQHYVVPQFPVDAEADVVPGVKLHQVVAVLRFIEEPAGSNSMIVLPTGCGKTGVAVLCAFTSGAQRVLVITPSLQISRQIQRDFGHITSFLVKSQLLREDYVGYVPPTVLLDHSNLQQANVAQQLVITNVQRIGSDDPESKTTQRLRVRNITDNFDLVIVDEAHHYPAATWKELIDHFHAKKLFLTGTPVRDGRPLPIAECFKLPREVAIQRNIIRRITANIVEGADFASSLMYVRRHAMLRLFSVSSSVSAAIDHHLQVHENNMQVPVQPLFGHQAMVLANSIVEATQFVEVFNGDAQRSARGRCDLYHGRTSASVLNRFVKCQSRVLVVVGRLTEGFDQPSVSVVAVVRNLGSSVLFQQFVGRAVRHKPDRSPTAVFISTPYFNQMPNFRGLFQDGNMPVAVVNAAEEAEEDAAEEAEEDAAEEANIVA
jgi:superfamily II DNA or RNA helicase